MENSLENKDLKSPLIYGLIFSITAILLGFFMGQKYALLILLAVIALPFVYSYQFIALNLFIIGYAFLPDILITAGEFLFLAIVIVERLINSRKIKANTLLIPIFLVISMAIINTFTSLNIIGSLRDLAFNIGGMSLLLYIYMTVDSKEKLNQLLTSLTIGAALVGLFGLFQFVFLGTVQREWIDASLENIITRRGFSVFLNPNIYAEYIVLVTPIIIGQFWAHKDKFKKFIYLGISALMMLNLLLTFSRGGLLAIAMAAVVFLFFAMRPLLGFFIPLGLLSINFLPEKIQNRIYSIFNFADSSTSYRFKMWGITEDLIREHPIVGVGFGHKPFKQEFELLIRSMPIFHTHNTYLEIMAETGALGIITFFYCIIASAVNILRSGLKSEDYYIRIISISVLASGAGILTHGIFEHIIYINRIIVMLWFNLALSGVIRNITENNI